MRRCDLGGVHGPEILFGLTNPWPQSLPKWLKILKNLCTHPLKFLLQNLCSKIRIFLALSSPKSVILSPHISTPLILSIRRYWRNIVVFLAVPLLLSILFDLALKILMLLPPDILRRFSIAELSTRHRLPKSPRLLLHFALILNAVYSLFIGTFQNLLLEINLILIQGAFWLCGIHVADFANDYENVICELRVSLCFDLRFLRRSLHYVEGQNF